MAEYEGKHPLGTDLVRWARGKSREFMTAAGTWRGQAVEAFALCAGDQWDDQAKQELESEGRPAFTFNRVAGFIRGICGLESSSRNEVRYYARELNDSGLSDVLNAAAKWVREGCDAEDEESDAFKDMLICGLGWTETYYSTEEDSDGQIIVERVDPLHMRWDPAARKRGLADSRWRARIKWLPRSTIADVWGEEKAKQIEDMLDTDTEMLDELLGTPHDATAAKEYDSDQLGNARRKNGYPVHQFQYVKTATVYKLVGPEGTVEELSEEQYKTVKERLGDLPFQKVKQRQYRQLIYCGDIELEDMELPTKGFTFNVMTGVRDRNEGIWYGFLRDLMDPQRWINKFFSSMADVVASQAKGGLLAEADAFQNKQKAEDEWADPRSIVWMNPGGMDKIKERTSAGLPAGFSQLLEFTVGSLPHVAGVNLEFLGMAGREQPGVLEHQRKQAAISTLAEFFNAMRLYRKQQGRVLLDMIDAYISDGRLIRIVGKESEQYVPLMRLPGAFCYDVVVDEAPNSPDQKMRTWDALTQILPVAADMGFPIPPDIIDYAPFPQSLIQKWKQFAGQQQGMDPKQMQQLQEENQKLQEENQQLKLKKEESMAKLQTDQQVAQQKMELEKQKMEMDLFVQMQKLQAELQKMQMQMGMEQERMQMEGVMEQQRQQQDLAIQAQQAEHSMAMSEREFEHGSDMADRKNTHDMKMAEKNAAAKAKQQKATTPRKEK